MLQYAQWHFIFKCSDMTSLIAADKTYNELYTYLLFIHIIIAFWRHQPRSDVVYMLRDDWRNLCVVAIYKGAARRVWPTLKSLSGFKQKGLHRGVKGEVPCNELNESDLKLFGACGIQYCGAGNRYWWTYARIMIIYIAILL